MLDSVPMRYKERLGSQKSWVTLQKKKRKEIMQHTRSEKEKRKSLNIRDLYHDIAKTIIRGGRL